MDCPPGRGPTSECAATVTSGVHDDALASAAFDGPIDVVGDVHGEIDALDDLLAALGYHGRGDHPAGRRLIFIGDLCDRGPDSPGVIRRVREMVGSDLARSMTEWVDRLEAILRDHSVDPASPEAICVHRAEGGTVSSSIIAIHGENARMHLFRHAAGPPCSTPYQTLEWPYGFFEAVLPPPTAYSAAD